MAVSPGSRWRLVRCPDAPELIGSEITLGERLEIEWHRLPKKQAKRTGEIYRRMWTIADQPYYYIAEDDLLRMWSHITE